MTSRPAEVARPSSVEIIDLESDRSNPHDRYSISDLGPRDRMSGLDRMSHLEPRGHISGLDSRGDRISGLEPRDRMLGLEPVDQKSGLDRRVGMFPSLESRERLRYIRPDSPPR